jgi:hypothetical protein
MSCQLDVGTGVIDSAVADLAQGLTRFADDLRRLKSVILHLVRDRAWTRLRIWKVGELGGLGGVVALQVRHSQVEGLVRG